MDSSASTQFNIPLATKKIFDKYQQIRGKNKEDFGIPFWDVVVLTTADEDQRVAYELQIQEKLNRKELPLGIPYHVYSDPPGPKAGCGGSTMYVLTKLHQVYGDKLWDLRVMLLNAGGQSQRLPSASVLGKIFTALPFGDPMYQVLDLKLAGYMPFLERMKPGVFHASSDTIEVYDLGESESWTFEKDGFTAFAHPSSLEIGTTHGVFVLDPHDKVTGQAAEFRNCLEVLQKPTIERMKERNAVLTGHEACGIEGEFAYTDSVFFFDHGISKKLLKFYEDEGSLTCEIDSYGDFLQALGPKATIDYTKDLRNVSTVEPSLVETREKIFHLLKGTPLNIVALNVSKFYHLGTVKEYLFHFCNDNVLAEEVGFEKHGVFNGLLQNLEEPNSKKAKLDRSNLQGCMMHNLLHPNSSVSESSIVEFCTFEAPVAIGKNCIVSNCCFTPKNDISTTSCQIPENTFLHTVPVKIPNRIQSSGDADEICHSEYVTIVLEVKENIKKKASDSQGASKLTFIRSDLNLESLSQSLKLDSVDKLFTQNQDKQPKFTLWHAKLFPVQKTAHDSFVASLELYQNALKNGCYSSKGLEKALFLSMADILEFKDVHTMVKERSELHSKIEAAF